jgi:hypothetical protein
MKTTIIIEKLKKKVEDRVNMEMLDKVNGKLLMMILPQLVHLENKIT